MLWPHTCRVDVVCVRWGDHASGQTSQSDQASRNGHTDLCSTFVHVDVVSSSWRTRLWCRVACPTTVEWGRPMPPQQGTGNLSRYTRSMNLHHHAQQHPLNVGSLCGQKRPFAVAEGWWVTGEFLCSPIYLASLRVRHSHKQVTSILQRSAACDIALHSLIITVNITSACTRVLAFAVLLLCSGWRDWCWHRC